MTKNTSPLEFLENVLQSRKYSELEKKRVLKDLEVFCTRLKKGEYKKTDFAGNKFNIPERTQEFLIYLELYCYNAQTWAKILKPLKIHRYKRIVDLCPGWTPKIELALFYLSYTGEVLILDKEADSSERVIKFMELFHPQYTIQKKEQDLFEPIKESYEVVIANHIVDDLVLHYFAKKMDIKPKDIYEKEGIFEDLWKKILRKKENHMQEILPILIEIFSKIVCKGGIVLLSQYKSYIENLLDLDEAVEFTVVLLRKVTTKLCEEGFEHLDDITKKALKGFKGHFEAEQCFVLKKR